MLTVDLHYDFGEGRFTCGPGCGEAEIRARLERFAGPVAAWHVHASAVPLILVEGRVGEANAPNQGRYYLAYVASQTVGTALVLTYLPSADSPDDGAAVWQAFSATLRESAAAAKVLPGTVLPLDFFDMAARANTFRPTADVFIAAARGGDANTALELVSPALIERLGNDLTTTILPFFARFAEFGGRITIAPFTDHRFNSGVAFHLTMVTRDGDERPFSIYVSEEDGRRVIADIVVDRDRAAGSN